MHISSSFSSPLTSGVNNKPNAPIKESGRSADRVAEINQDKSSNQQAKPNVVIDEQAIAFFEQNQLIQSQSSKENFSFDDSSTSQDQPSAKNETAVASYQAVGNLAQRESVQQLFGVDLYA